MEGGSPKQSWENGTNRRVKTKNHLSVELGPRQPPRGPATCEESPARRWEPVAGYSGPSGGAAAVSGCAHPPRLCSPAAVGLGYGDGLWLRGSYVPQKSQRFLSASQAHVGAAAGLVSPAAGPGPPAPAGIARRSLASPGPPFIYFFFFS